MTLTCCSSLRQQSLAPPAGEVYYQQIEIMNWQSIDDIPAVPECAVLNLPQI